MVSISTLIRLNNFQLISCAPTFSWTNALLSMPKCVLRMSWIRRILSSRSLLPSSVGGSVRLYDNNNIISRNKRQINRLLMLLKLTYVTWTSFIFNSFSTSKKSPARPNREIASSIEPFSRAILPAWNNISSTYKLCNTHQKSESDITSVLKHAK